MYMPCPYIYIYTILYNEVLCICIYMLIYFLIIYVFIYIYIRQIYKIYKARMNTKHIYLYTILLLHPESLLLNTGTMNGYTNEVPISNVDYLPHHCSSHNFMILQFFVLFCRTFMNHFPFSFKKNTAPQTLATIGSTSKKTNPPAGPVVEMYAAHLAAVPMFVSFTHAEIDPRSCQAPS